MSTVAKLSITQIGQGRPVVLLHGQISSHKYWQRVIPLVPGMLVLPDLLGFGDSPKPKDAEYTIDDQLGSLAESLMEIPRPFLLVGHSMGAQLATAYALKYPKHVSRLVLSAMPCMPDGQGYAYLAKEFPQMRYFLKGRFAKNSCDWHVKHHARAEKLMRRYGRAHSYIPVDVLSDTLRHTWESLHKCMDNIVVGYDAYKDLEILDIPVDILIGQKDFITVDAPKKIAHMQKSNIRVHTLAGAKHNLPLQHPEVIADVIRDRL